MTKAEREKNITTALALAHIMGQAVGKQPFNLMNFKIAQAHICELAGADNDNSIKKVLNGLIRGEA
jgi:hypothetical protein